MKTSNQAGVKSSRASHQKQPPKQAASRPPKPAGQGRQWLEVEFPETWLPYIDHAIQMLGVTQEQFIETAVREKIARAEEQDTHFPGVPPGIPVAKEDCEGVMKPGEEILMDHARFELQQGVDFALFAIKELQDKLGEIGCDEFTPFTRKKGQGYLWLAGRAIRQFNIAYGRAFKWWLSCYPEGGGKTAINRTSTEEVWIWRRLKQKMELAQFFLAASGLHLSKVEIDADGRMKEDEASATLLEGLFLTSVTLEECLRRDHQAIDALLVATQGLQPHPLAPSKFRAPNPPGMVRILGKIDSRTERVHTKRPELKLKKRNEGGEVSA